MDSLVVHGEKFRSMTVDLSPAEEVLYGGLLQEGEGREPNVSGPIPREYSEAEEAGIRAALQGLGYIE